MKATTRKTVKEAAVSALAAVIVLGLFLNLSCLPKDKGVRVVVHLERKNISQGSLLILNFREPPHAEGMGAYTAERFHIHLLEAKKFKVVALETNSPWSRMGQNEEERLLIALDEPRTKDFDYIMLGELKECYDGGINKSRLGLKVRIIEVQTRITVFLAETYQETHGKDPSYPMVTKFSQPSSPPKILVEKILPEMINKI